MEAHEAGGEDLAELGEAVGGGEAVWRQRCRADLGVEHGDQL